MTLDAKKTLITALIAALHALPALAAESAPLPSDHLQPAALARAGIYDLRRLEPQLTGAGIRCAVICRSITYIDNQPQNDYRPDAIHRCLAAARLTFHEQITPPAGISPHATAVCSILFGRDPDAFDPTLGRFIYEGLIPDADAHIYEFTHFVATKVFSASPPPAEVLSISLGTEFETDWTRGIEALVERYGTIVVASIGNGLEAYDPALYPAAGANVIGVGVVDSVDANNLAVALANFALARPEHSTHGPAGTGRAKPDIVAPGNCLAAVALEPNGYRPTGNWSSFATPIVAGTAALLLQELTQNPDLAAGAAQNTNCLIKAILLNSAAKLPFWHKGLLGAEDDHTAPLDRIQGAGMLDALAAYKQLAAGRAAPGNVPPTAWDNNRLGPGTDSQKVYRFTIPEPDGRLITATAAWNNHFSPVYPFNPLPENNSNLRLELWAVDPNDPNRDTMLDYSDSPIDNVEHIHCPADPNYTTYEIVIAVNDTDGDGRPDGTENYALAWTVAPRHQRNHLLWYDLNTDGIVNKADFVILVHNLLRSREAPDDYLIGDINTDGAIDLADVQILLEHTGLTADWYTGPTGKPLAKADVPTP